MSLSEETRKLLEDAYKESSLDIISEIIAITKKYEGIEGAGLLECGIDDLQADALRLVSMNIHIGTLAGILEADALRAENIRKFKDAEVYLVAKDEGGTVEELKRRAEVGVAPYRQREVDTLRKAKIMRQTVDSVSEMVNMLKKIVERMMWEGPSSNL